MNGYLNAVRIAILVGLFISIPAHTQEYFETAFDSTQGIGYVDSLAMFEGSITNLQDSPLRILWTRSLEIPQDWRVEICQLTRYCWPDFVDGDTIVLRAQQVDTLQIKFYPHSQGVGSVHLTLTVEDDPQVSQELTFRLEARPSGIPSPDDRQGPGLRWRSEEGNGIRFYLPLAAAVRLELYDLQGRRVANIWNGFLSGGEHALSLFPPQLPSGIYYMELTAKGFPPLYRKVSRVK